MCGNDDKVAMFRYSVEPAEGNAQGELPLTILVKRILETATFHAEKWSVGYSSLIKSRLAWVLARLAVEMRRYPKINEDYVIETWVESYNKHFSARNFRFSSPQGEIYGYARTIWSVIDIDTRISVDLSTLDCFSDRVSGIECPIDRQSKLKPVEGEPLVSYPVRYSDIDLNRHVNSVKYIEHMLDTFSLQQYDENMIGRFEINYMSEIRYGMWFVFYRREFDNSCFELELKNRNHEGICRGKVWFVPREKKERN